MIDSLRWKCPHCRAPQVGDGAQRGIDASRTCRKCNGKWRIDHDSFQRWFFVLFALDGVFATLLILAASGAGLIATAVAIITVPVLSLLLMRMVIVKLVRPQPIGAIAGDAKLT